MFARKNSTLIGTEPTILNTKNYLSTAFSSACTVNPFDVENTKSSYFQSFALLAIISSLSSIVTILRLESTLNIQQYLIAFLVSHLSTLALYSLCAYLYAYLGCKILGLDYSTQDFGIVASSLIPLPLLVLVDFFEKEILSYAVYFAIVLIMPYYLNSTYQRYFNMGTERTRFFYGVFGFIGFIMILKTAKFFSLGYLPLHALPAILKND